MASIKEQMHGTESAAAKIMRKAKSGGGKTLASKRAEAVKGQKSLDNKLLPPSILNARRVEKEAKKAMEFDGSTSGRSQGFPVGAYHAGRWTRPDPRDTDYQIRQELLAAGPDGGKNGITPLGMMQVDEGVIGYLKDKKEHQAYLQELVLGEWMIDGTDPISQIRTYELYPELKEIPDQQHRTDLAMQEGLRTILRDGILHSRKDNQLIAKICRDDYILPTYPAWDPQGVIMGDIAKTTEWQQLYREGVRRGLFNPREWANNAALASKNKDLQRKIKAVILRRCYAGLRTKSDDDLKFVFEKMSDMEDKVGTPTAPMSNSTVGWFNGMTGGLGPYTAK